MTIHGPGSPIYMSEIAAEFGGSPPYYLSQYYAGGGRVPPGTTGAYGPIPSSGTISMQQFYGASAGGGGPTVLDTQTITNGFYFDGGTATSYYGFGTVGPTPANFGSISDGTSNIYGGAPIVAFYWDSVSTEIFFVLAGVRANSGWTTVTLNGTPYNRASAAYGAITNTAWGWVGVPNPFGGASTVAVFT